jgi:hypothetical protein
MRRPLHLTGGYLGAIVGMFLSALAGVVNGRGVSVGRERSDAYPAPSGGNNSSRRRHVIPQGITADPEAVRRARIRMMCTGPAQWMHLGVRTPLQGIHSQRRGRGIGGKARRRGMVSRRGR